MLNAEVRKQVRRTGAAIAVGVAAAVVTPAAHDPITTKVSWNREIAPLFQARCVTCHSPGGRAPMSLATYEDARPWARAIREEVLARRMPKWSAVRGYGDFSNDPSLSPFEIALVTAWADGGAPKAASSPAADPRQPSNARSPHEVSPAQGGAEPPTKTVTVPCTAPALPKGRLVGIRPTLAEGASLRLDLHFPDGRAEPLIWIRAFDPHFAETYQLRTPALLDRGTKLSTDGATGDACRLALAILPE